MENPFGTMTVQTIVYHLMREWSTLPSFHKVVEKVAHVCFLSPDEAHDLVVSALRDPDEKVFATGELVMEDGRCPCSIRHLPEERVVGVDWNTVTCCVRPEAFQELESEYFSFREHLLWKQRGQLSEMRAARHDTKVKIQQLAAQLTEFEVEPLEFSEGLDDDGGC